MEVMNLARLGINIWQMKNHGNWLKQMKFAQNNYEYCLQIAANLSVVSEPFMPFSAHKLSGMLGLDQLSWKDAGSDALIERFKN